MKTNNIMGFKSFIHKVKESYRDRKKDEILDKMIAKKPITDFEKEFLKNFDTIDTKDMMDFVMLDKQTTHNQITYLLNKGCKIICNLSDRNGKIGLPIVSIYNDFNDEFSTVKVTSGEKCKLKTNYLYNIIYNNRKNEYSLEEHDVYYEKIPVNNDDT